MQRVFEVMEKVAQTDATVLLTRRDGHRQGSRRARHPLCGRAQGAPLRRAELRRAARHAARERAVRPQARRLHRRARRQEGPVRARATAARSSSTRSARPSPGMQVRLLRVLQDGEIRPLGSSETQRVDVRIIAATNRDLRKLVAGGPLPRGSLLPPARRRDRACRRCASGARTSPRSRTTSSIARTRRCAARSRASPTPRWIASCAHSWSGNVRELENEIERTVALAGDADDDHVEMLSEHVRGPTPAQSATGHRAACGARSEPRRRRAQAPR